MQVIKIKDIILPPEREKFNDVYIVYELMDTDLHQIIRSNQELTEDHCQVILDLLCYANPFIAVCSLACLDELLSMFHMLFI